MCALTAVGYFRGRVHTRGGPDTHVERARERERERERARAHKKMGEKRTKRRVRLKNWQIRRSAPPPPPPPPTSPLSPPAGLAYQTKRQFRFGNASDMA